MCLTFFVSVSTLVMIFVAATFGFLHGFEQGLLSRPPQPQHQSQSRCRNPDIRREWRSLTPSEQQNYLDAAKCLEETPSSLMGQGTLYDDLVYVHMHVGSLCKCTVMPAYVLDS